MKIGLIFALQQEYEQVRKLLGGRSEGVVGQNEVVVRMSGMGKVNAALGAAEFINEYPLDCLVSTGVAGGLDPSLRSLDVVAAREVVYHDVWCGEGNAYGQVQGLPERFRTNDVLYAKALATGARGGLFCSGDFFISGCEVEIVFANQAKAILDHFPEGMAVDMESGALAQVCHLHDVPFISLRIISDTAGEDHQSEYDNFWAAVAEDSFNAVRNFLNALPSEL